MSTLSATPTQTPDSWISDRLSSSEWTLGDREQALARTAASGLTAIELDAAPELEAAIVAGQLSEAGLHVKSLCWRWNPDAELGSPDPRSRAAAQRYLLSALGQAQELGAGQLVVIPACRETPWIEETTEAALDRTASAIRDVLADAPDDVRLSLEALRRDESFLMNTLDEADALRQRVDDPRAWLLADIYHIAALDGTVSDLLRPHVASISLVHWAAPDRSRVRPHAADVAEVVQVLTVDGFTGPITLEYDVPSDEDLAAAVVDAHSVWTRSTPTSP